MYRFLIVVLIIYLSSSCKEIVSQKDPYNWLPITVIATAYNSTPAQTSYEHPAITAWGRFN